MHRSISLYFYSLIIFVQFYENVNSMRDALVDISKLEIPDDIKKLLLEYQYQNARLQLELLELRNNPKKSCVINDISKDVTITTEKSQIVVEAQTAAPTKTLVETTKTPQTTKNNQLETCSDINGKESGVYQLSNYVAGGLPLDVYCDFDTQAGGWTIIQRRTNGSVKFNRSWQDYKNGFGNVSSEYWLGLDHINKMTTTEPQELLIVLEDFDNQTRWAKYDLFTVGNETEKYAINSLGVYSGDAGNSLSGHLNHKFSTPDVDNDTWKERSCAESYKSGWWFNRCLTANLNGPTIKGKFGTSHCCRGIHWLAFRGGQYSLKSAKMMLRPKSYVVME